MVLISKWKAQTNSTRSYGIKAKIRCSNPRQILWLRKAQGGIIYDFLTSPPGLPAVWELMLWCLSGCTGMNLCPGYRWCISRMPPNPWVFRPRKQWRNTHFFLNKEESLLMFYRSILWSLRALLGLALLGSKELPRGKGLCSGWREAPWQEEWSVTFIDLPGEKTSDRVIPDLEEHPSLPWG